MNQMLELSEREFKITNLYLKGSSGKGEQHAKPDGKFQQSNEYSKENNENPKKKKKKKKIKPS